MLLNWLGTQLRICQAIRRSSTGGAFLVRVMEPRRFSSQIICKTKLMFFQSRKNRYSHDVFVIVREKKCRDMDEQIVF